MEDRKGEKRQETVYGIEQEERRRSDSPGGRVVIKAANVRIWLNGCSQRATENWF